MRGRNNNNNGGNRKGPNPLTRSYESNGPDVKIRGTAQHIGEKYLQLARDAQTSGDPVAAESYLQHAEHYFRLIASAQQAQYQAQAGYVRQPGDAEPEDDGDDDDLNIPDRFALPSERMPPPPPLPPVPQAQPPMGERPAFPERQGFADRQEGGERPYRQDRPNYERDGRPDRNGPERNAERQGGDRATFDRNGGDRAGFERPRQERPDNRPEGRQDRGDRPFRNRFGRDNGEFREQRDPQYREQPRIPAAPRPPADVRTMETPQPDIGPDLPAFITAPVRVPPQAIEAAEIPNEASAFIAESPGMPTAEPANAVGEPVAEQFAARPRRRRRSRVAESEAAPEVADRPAED